MHFTQVQGSLSVLCCVLVHSNFYNSLLLWLYSCASKYKLIIFLSTPTRARNRLHRIIPCSQHSIILTLQYWGMSSFRVRSVHCTADLVHCTANSFYYTVDSIYCIVDSVYFTVSSRGQKNKIWLLAKKRKKIIQV